jgi:hypothetical protein
MKDLETIFRERRTACDGVIICPIDDWNSIVSQVSDLESINVEMYAMLEKLLCLEGLIKTDEIKALLAKARGES